MVSVKTLGLALLTSLPTAYVGKEIGEFADERHLKDARIIFDSNAELHRVGNSTMTQGALIGSSKYLTAAENSNFYRNLIGILCGSTTLMSSALLMNRIAKLKENQKTSERNANFVTVLSRDLNQALLENTLQSETINQAEEMMEAMQASDAVDLETFPQADLTLTKAMADLMDLDLADLAKMPKSEILDRFKQFVRSEIFLELTRNDNDRNLN